MFELNDIRTWFLILQGLFLTLSIIFILMQNRGAGLSGSFGGGDEVYLTRRGIEKSVVTLTVVSITLFVALRIGSFYLPQYEFINDQPEAALEGQNPELQGIDQELNFEDLNLEDFDFEVGE